MTDYSDGLYELTKFIDTKTGEDNIQGILGGEHGYGHEYKNDVFEMHPYYWGDCECGFEDKDFQWSEENKHSEDCYQTIKHDMCYEGRDSWDRKKGHGYNECDCAERLCKKMGLTYPYGSAVHCTCGHTERYAEWRKANDHDPECRMVLPNFRHYASGLEIEWYKYIGRGMESNQDLTRREWNAILDECEDSVLRDIGENK